MNDNLLTVKEVAEITGLSQQNIYKQLSTNLNQYVETVQTKKMLQYQVITEYFKLELPIEFKVRFRLITEEEAAFQLETTALNSNPPDSTDDSTVLKQIKPNVQPDSTNDSNDLNPIQPDIQLNSTVPNNDIVEFLKEQLKEKDKLINDLRSEIKDHVKQNHDISNRLATLFENSQQLQQNQQLLEAKTITELEEEPKKGLFKKIFGKK